MISSHTITAGVKEWRIYQPLTTSRTTNKRKERLCARKLKQETRRKEAIWWRFQRQCENSLAFWRWDNLVMEAWLSLSFHTPPIMMTPDRFLGQQKKEREEDCWPERNLKQREKEKIPAAPQGKIIRLLAAGIHLLSLHAPIISSLGPSAWRNPKIGRQD